MKRALALALALIATTAAGDQFRRFQRNDMTSSAAFFEFAPESGAGMSATCACTAVTGAKGEVITHTRASSAYCTREGLATTGLTTSSMSLCGNNLPRVEADGSGVRGLRMEDAVTNIALRSEEMDSAPWALVNAGGATIGVFANGATTPWGAVTAERLAFSGTSGGSQAAEINQPISLVSGTSYVCSGYYRGDGAAGEIYQWFFDGTVKALTLCQYNATTWTRCFIPPTVSALTGSGVFAMGQNTFIAGQPAVQAATNVFAGGMQCEVGLGQPTSYITTVASTVTRAADSNAINGNALGFPGAPFSVSAWVTLQAPITNDFTVAVDGQAGSASGAALFFQVGFYRFQTLNAGGVLVGTAPGPLSPGVARKLGGLNIGGTSTLYLNGAIVAGPTATNNAAQPWSTATGIGYGPSFGANSTIKGIISRVCLDSSNRCNQ